MPYYLVPLLLASTDLMPGTQVSARATTRVRNMLHVVLCMSPVGDKLSSRCRKFPVPAVLSATNGTDSSRGPAICTDSAYGATRADQLHHAADVIDLVLTNCMLQRDSYTVSRTTSAYAAMRLLCRLP
eukprot:3113324-Rhodomonas_salina.2